MLDFTREAVFFSYLVSMWGYKQDHICTFISDQRLQMNWNAGRCPCKCVIMIFYLSGSHFLVFTWLYCSDKKHSDLLLQKARICPVSVFEQWTDTYCNCIVSRLWVILRAPIKCQQSEMLKYACEINAVFIDFFLFLKQVVQRCRVCIYWVCFWIDEHEIFFNWLLVWANWELWIWIIYVMRSQHSGHEAWSSGAITH